jgi:DNA-binding PucR family transcriptional regulator
VEYTDGRAHDFLLSIADPSYLSSFADAVLAPIDRAGNAGTLLETLHAWLAEGRSVAACSERLRVHRHTVRNRIQHITRLLGRDVDSVDAQTELWLALKARGLRDES